MSIQERIDLVGNVKAQARSWAREIDRLAAKMRGLNGMGVGGGAGASRSGQGSARVEQARARAMRDQARQQASIARSDAKSARAAKQYLPGRNEANASAVQRHREQAQAAKAAARAQAQASKTSQKAANDNARARKGDYRYTLQRQEKGGIGGAVNSFAGNAMADMASSAASYAADAATYMASAFIDARKFREQSLISLKLLTKSGSRAKEIWTESYKVARDMGMSQKDVVQSKVSLLGAGFKEGEADNITKMLADFKGGGFSTNIQGFMLALTQIKGMGKATAEELNQLVENSGGAISRGALFEQIAKMKGLKGGVAEVTKLMEGGKVSADDMMKAMLAVNEQRTGMKTGEFAKQNSTSLTAMLGRLGSAPEGFFAGLEMNPKAGESMRKSLSSLLDLLDPTTAKGEKFATSFAKMIDVVAGPGADMFAKMVDAAPGFMATLTTIGTAIGPVVSVLGWFAEQAILVGQGIGTIIGWFQKLQAAVPQIDLFSGILGPIWNAINSIPSLLSTLTGTVSVSGSSIGMALVQGITTGIFGGQSSVISAAVGMATSAASAAKAALGIASPSKVFAAMGEQIPAGLSVGMRDNMAIVERDAAAMANGATSSAQSALPFVGDAMAERGMGRQTTNNFGGIRFNAGGFNVGGPSQANPSDIAQDINRLIAQGVQNFMNKAAEAA